jgi:hypothetical protein
VGSGKKAFCTVNLSGFSPNCAQLYPQELWISFYVHSARSTPVEKHSRSARHVCQRTRAAMQQLRLPSMNGTRASRRASLAQMSCRS